MIPAGQLTDEQRSNQPDLTILHLLPMEYFAMEYVEGGRVKQGFVVRSNGEFYMDMNGQKWLGELRPLSAKLAANASDVYARIKGVVPTDLPVTDQVDVVAGEVAQEEESK